jgi:hypothetical protein
VADAPDWADVRDLVAPFMDGEVEAGTFFRVKRSGGRQSKIGVLIFGAKRFALERQTGLGAFTYVAIHGRDVGLFELRWAPLKVHRVIGHWPLDALDAQRIDDDCISILLDGRPVELEAAAPGIDATELIDRLTAP